MMWCDDGIGRSLAHLGGLELHEGAPLATDVAKIGRSALDAPSDGVICAGKEAFGLELEVGVEVMGAVAHGACVSELEDHLSKQDAARIHVRHRQHVLCKSGKRKGKRRAMVGAKARRRPVTQKHVSQSARVFDLVWGRGRGEGGGGKEEYAIDLPESSGRPMSVIRLSPSITVETELPRNLDFGRSSPTTATLFAGET